MKVYAQLNEQNRVVAVLHVHRHDNKEIDKPQAHQVDVTTIDQSHLLVGKEHKPATAPLLFIEPKT